MLVILSPAKDMSILPSEQRHTSAFTQAQFLSKAKGLVGELRKLKQNELATLMNINDKLAKLNYDRFHNWYEEHSFENSTHAILSFKGEAYRGLNADDFDASDLDFAQNSLRILSGLYGVLRPLDLIQAYRLEMGTKRSFSGKKNLYEYWKSIITNAINEAFESSPGEKVLINLASNEYASAIDIKKLKCNIITPSFYEENNGKHKMVTVYAKKARGMMTRFMVKNRLGNSEDLKAFNVDGYYFDNQQSTDDKWVFVR